MIEIHPECIPISEVYDFVRNNGAFPSFGSLKKPSCLKIIKGVYALVKKGIIKEFMIMGDSETFYEEADTLLTEERNAKAMFSSLASGTGNANSKRNLDADTETSNWSHKQIKK